MIKGDLPMTRPSAIVMLAAILMLAAPAASRAQGDARAPPAGTNSAGTAQSSGKALNRDSGTTTGSAGMGSGKAAVSPSTSPEAAIKDENATIDRKLKSICRGC
jgi:hypothetical protein